MYDTHLICKMSQSMSFPRTRESRALVIVRRLDSRVRENDKRAIVTNNLSKWYNTGFRNCGYILLICGLCLAFSACLKEMDAVESLPLMGVWKFKADPEGVGENEKWYSKELDASSWEDIGVPGTWNEGQDVSVAWNYEGYGWLRRKIKLPENWQSGNIRLRFLAVYLIADVWLNGKYLGNHKGGYTEFSFDVSEALDFTKNAENVLVVRADNKKRPFQVPGRSIDWWNCGGITREAFLERHPDIYLQKMFVTPDIINEKASVDVQVWLDSKLDSPRDVDVKIDVIYDDQVVTMAGWKAASIPPEGRKLGVTLDVDQPRLWSPDTPELYDLKLWWRLSGEDEWRTHEDRFGIRKIEARGTELFLNGEKIWLQGIAFHQDYPGMGSAVTHEAQRKDLETIKGLNANFVRLGHYPFHKYSLDVCDEIGLLAWSEVPVWQNSPEELANEEMYQQWIKPQIDEMIDQQYNHPSVVFWSIGNEFSRAWNDVPEIVNYVKRATDYVRERDSSRLVSYASAATTGANSWRFLDVIGKPLHYGWFHSPSVYDVDARTDEIHAYLPDKPIFPVELCGMSYPDDHKGYSQDARFSVEYHDKLLKVDFQHLMIRKEFVCGVTLWTLADLKGGREKGTYGILNRERQQVKHIYETVKNLYSSDPKLLIIDSRTAYQPGERLEVDFWSFDRFQNEEIPVKIRWWITGSNGRMKEGQFDAIVEPDSAKKIGGASWDIPAGESGFHSLLCVMEDEDGNRLFINDYYFDVGAPEAPAILWVKVVDGEGELVSGADVEIGGFTRTTDGFGRTPFLLNTGEYKAAVTANGETLEKEAEVKSGETTEIVIGLK